MTILFQGDSVTDCGRGNSGGCGYEQGQMGPGYPGLIKSRLSCDRPDAGFEFVNLGISGNRIVDLYARWRADCLNHEPDIVSILVGVNDSWHEQHRNGVEVPRAIRIYNELLDWTIEKLPAVKLVLLEPFTAGESDNGKLFLDDLRSRAPWQHWTADGVHPTPAFHQAIADAWLRAAAPFLG